MKIERRGYMSEESNLKDIIVIKRNGKKVPFDETKKYFSASAVGFLCSK